ncbi:hypothetical protein ACFXGA_36515 [Actinosynnema sp. NPDC059335]|uniref:hypothetical protein n=1 Tax=Actinosynnema sp. NPDC059335 TaxID=3346804 RepID=UPI003672876B
MVVLPPPPAGVNDSIHVMIFEPDGRCVVFETGGGPDDDVPVVVDITADRGVGAPVDVNPGDGVNADDDASGESNAGGSGVGECAPVVPRTTGTSA